MKEETRHSIVSPHIETIGLIVLKLEAEYRLIIGRKVSLIDNFLNSLPKEEKKTRKVKADATVDYMEYLLQTEQEFAEIGVHLIYY
mgnify:CR=1 FL=1